MEISVKAAQRSYNIILERGVLSRVDKYLALDRRVLIVTDDGVPAEYAGLVAEKCKTAYTVTLPQGESSKNIKNLELLLSSLVEYGFTRSDCVVAVGGGVVGDIAGFAASVYMRGIDFYNVPTTLLSQVDSSIGGKTAIDFMGFKNIVGAFYPPKAVLIDPDTLKTLPARQISNGLAEALKMAITSDKEMFCLFESGNALDHLETVIERSILIKKSVVEQDERESGIRRVLNFGHTLAHAIEAENAMKNYYHGECVAIGMLAMCRKEVGRRLLPILDSLNLPSKLSCGDIEKIIDACRHDKKLEGDYITAVYVEEIGEYKLIRMPFSEFEKTIREALL